jgi:hypothetical protein
MASCLNEGFSFSHLPLFFSTVAPSSRLFEGSVLLLKARALLTRSLAQLPSRCASRGTLDERSNDLPTGGPISCVQSILDS